MEPNARNEDSQLLGMLYWATPLCWAPLDIQRQGDRDALRRLHRAARTASRFMASGQAPRRLYPLRRPGSVAQWYLKDKQGVYTNDGFREAWRQYMTGYGGYMDMASKESLASFEKSGTEGSHSDELGGAARLAPVLYWVENPWTALDVTVSRVSSHTTASRHGWRRRFLRG